MGGSLGAAMCGFHFPLLEEMELAQDSGSSESNGSSSQGVQLEQPSSIQRAKWPPLEAPSMGMSQFLSKEVDFPVRSEKKVCPAIETIDLSDPDAFKRVEALLLECKKTAKTRLFEICAAKSWAPPEFQCHEEGQDLDKMFNCSCKVVVQVQGRGSTLIECIGEAKSRKNAAEEHAAEGALWYLKHIGYH